MTAEEINRIKYMVCCPMCDNKKCVRKTDKCEAERWAKNKAGKRGQGMTEYKPLTPSFRQEINAGFDERIADLQTCQPNALVNAQIEALRMGKRLINGLPDGYPMPLKDRK